MAEWIPGSVPRILCSISDSETSALLFDYNGITLEEFSRDIAVKNSRQREVADILFQASLIVMSLAIKTNLANGDLHSRNLLVKVLPHSSLRRFVLFGDSEQSVTIEYESKLLVTVADWANWNTLVPYGKSRSGFSRSRSGSQSNAGNFVPPSAASLLFDILKFVVKFDSIARLFVEAPAGFSGLLGLGKIKELLELKVSGVFPDVFMDISTWQVRVYHFFTDPHPPIALAPTKSKRGRKRRHQDDAARSAAYRLRKKAKTSDHLNVLADFAVSLIEEFPHDQVPSENVLFDVFGYRYMDSIPGLLLSWSTVCRGLGVFCDSVIERNSYITYYSGYILDQSELENMKDWQKSHCRAISKLRSWIDGIRFPSPVLGVASFINSSTSPSGANATFVVEDSGRVRVHALSDIPSYAEILIDYNIGWDQ